jgi:hypothetical protein
MTGSSTDGQSYTYSAIGNLTSKTGLGTLSYPASGPGSMRPCGQPEYLTVIGAN